MSIIAPAYAGEFELLSHLARGMMCEYVSLVQVVYYTKPCSYAFWGCGNETKCLIECTYKLFNLLLHTCTCTCH